MKRSFGVVPFSRRRRAPRGVIKAKGPASLARWIARAHPAALKKAMAANPQLFAAAGLGSIAAGAPSLVDKATSIANAVLPFIQLEAQRKLLKVQVKRAEQGLPPLDTTNIDVPAARAEVDVGPGTRSMVTKVGLGLAALAALWLFLGRRRRA